MPRQNTRGRTFTTRRRSPTTWSRTVSIGPLTVAAATKVVFSTFVLNNPGIGETVRRTRGMLSIGADAVSVEEQTGALGFVVVSDLALAAGAASIPGPFTDGSDDGWFVWQPFVQTAQEGTISNLTSYQYAFDSKAMRRVEEGFGIAVMLENSSATFGLRATIAIAMLTSIS